MSTRAAFGASLILNMSAALDGSVRADQVWLHISPRAESIAFERGARIDYEAWLTHANPIRFRVLAPDQAIGTFNLLTPTRMTLRRTGCGPEI